MNISDELNSRIENYVSGLMQDEEKSAFEKEMSNDESLLKAVALEKRIQSGFEKKGEIELKERIKSISTEVREASKVIPLRNKWIRVLSVAASIALVATTYFFLRPQGNNLGQGDYMAMIDSQLGNKDNYISGYLNKSSLRGDIDKSDQKKKLKEVYDVISKGDILSAKRIVTAYLKEYPDDPEGIYARAQIFLNEDNYGKALENLNLLTDIDNRELRNEALYYSGLCYFKIKNGKEEGLKIMNKIAEDDRSEYKESAITLIEYMK